MTNKLNPVTVSVTVQAPLETVWNSFNEPRHITQWCFAIPEWHCPSAENDLRTGGSFKSRMEARDGSMGFDFGGVYEEVTDYQGFNYVMGDGRRVMVSFSEEGNSTTVTETFDPETQNDPEMQRQGWQMILNNFKAYTESLA